MKKTKKFLSVFLSLILVLSVVPMSSIEASASTYDAPVLNSEGYYELSTADHLYWFAEQVNSGNNAINGMLMNDIVVNEGDLSGYDGESENTWREWTPIGTESFFYTGTFEGTGYSISGLYFNNAEANFIGLFGVVAGTVKNLGVENSYFKGNMAIGGICAYLYGGTVEKLYNLSTIVGISYVGGICGYNYGIMNSSYNIGSIFGVECVGGICGYNQSTIKNSYNTGAVNGTHFVGGICGYGLANNCFYLTNCATDESGIIQSQIGNEATAEQFASGEICYALNEGITAGNQAWYQNIDNSDATDETPQFSGGTVYYVCHKDLITNYYEESIHNYQDGYCSVCSAYQWTVTKDNYESLGLTEAYIGYEAIYNYNQLCSFAGKVNSGKNAVNAVLMNDIVANDGDLSDYDGESENSWAEWTPIGTDNVVCYSGTFDGNGHTISGIYFNNSDINNVGLFGYVDKATIKNVGLVNSYIEGKQYVGGICGYNHSGNIENCFNSSTVIGSRIVGGICGYHYYGLLVSCYNIGTVKGSSSSVGSICGEAEKTIENCYYLSGSATYNGTTRNGIGGTTDVYGKTMVATAEQFASGEVAYLLNNGVTDGTQVWYQNLDNGKIVDASPKLVGGTVYKYEICTENGALYTYGNTFVVTEHNYEYGICLICGKYLDLITEDNYASLGLTQEYIGYYGISNSEQLYWFAEQVNSGNNEINGVLLNDIVVNEGDLSGYDGTSENTWREWTPIGFEKKYSGTFDGAGYSVSGLYFNDTTAGGGLFGSIYKGTIKNIGVEKSYFNCCGGGGICSFIYYGTIKNCYNTSTIVGVGEANEVGGICGWFSHSTEIINCYNTGEISGAIAGGISGYGLSESHTPSNITNCYNTGKINGIYNSAAILGLHFPDSNITVSNCYYLKGCSTFGIGSTSGNSGSDPVGVTMVKTADQFASGEVAYLLNKSVTDGTQAWYQNIDNGEAVDKLPDFVGGTVYQNDFCVESGFSISYSNTHILTKHNFNNGFCVNCGMEESATLVTEDNYASLGLKQEYIGYYGISNSGQLYWFAEQVNSGNNDEINGVLMNDIVVNEGDLSGYDGASENPWKEWTPIGTSNDVILYSGIFDGRNYSVSGLYFNNSEADYIGLFGASVGTVKNIGIKNSYFNGDAYVGGVCGYQRSAGVIENCYSSATIKGRAESGGICGNNSGAVNKCYNKGEIITTDFSAGGICGYSVGQIVECYNTGFVSSDRQVGGICGNDDVDGNGSIISKCYNIGSVKGLSCKVGGICGSDDAEVIECYYLKDCAKDGQNVAQFGRGSTSLGTRNWDESNETISKTADQFTSGEVAYLLNGSISDDENIWKQNIGTDSYPKLNGNIVYKVYNCNNQPIYSNSNKNINEHNFVDGNCTICEIACEHTWKNGICSICEKVCEHNWDSGTCTICEKVCEHNWVNGTCSICEIKLTGIADNHLYLDGVMQKAYQLVEFEGDFYYIGDRHEIIKGRKAYVKEDRINGLTYADGTPITAGTYEFDENGKMVILNGVVGNKIYKNNTMLKAYQLVEVDGEFYYIGDRHEIIKGRKAYVKEDRINGLTYADGTPITAGTYEFDENGKMVILNGVVDNHIYKNNTMLKAYQLVEVDGDIYYIGDRHEIIKGRKAYVKEDRINGLTLPDGTPITVGYYEFDENGKLIVE